MTSRFASRRTSLPRTLLAATTAVGLMPLSGALLFSDNFDVNAGTNINAAIGSPRQGGFTENFVTLGGTWAAGTAGLDTHLFDNLSIEGTPIPEPSSAVLATLPFLAFLLRRRTR